MPETSIRREVQEDGTVVLSDSRCRFTYRRIAPGAVEMRIYGIDDGTLGRAPMDEVALAWTAEGPIELFVDATQASMPSVPVSRAWSKFFAINQKSLKRVSILAGSKAVELTVAIAQHLSRTGRLIQIYTDRELYRMRKRMVENAGRSLAAFTTVDTRETRH